VALLPVAAQARNTVGLEAFRLLLSHPRRTCLRPKPRGISHFREGYHLVQALPDPEAVPFGPNSRNEALPQPIRPVLLVLVLDLVIPLPFVLKLSASTVVLLHHKDEHQ
jgi:hypothetical protein